MRARISVAFMTLILSVSAMDSDKLVVPLLSCLCSLSYLWCASRKEEKMDEKSNKWVESVMITDWLDCLLDITSKLQHLTTLGKDIEIVAGYEAIQIFKGLDIIASAIGAEIKEAPWPGKEYHFCYGFKYRGRGFFQLSKTRWEGFSDDV